MVMCNLLHRPAALLEREHFPFPSHPRRQEISSALASYNALALAHAPAASAPELEPVDGPEAAARGPAMTLQEITSALSSSLAAELAPALRELAHMADDGAVADLQMYISHVSSKRILGHADFTVRAAAVSALAALVKCDEDSLAAAGAKRKATGRPPTLEPELKNYGPLQMEKAKQKQREEAEQYSAFIATQYYYYLEVPPFLCAFSC